MTWLSAAMAFNLTRAAGALASTFHANATTGTIRATAVTRFGPLRQPKTNMPVDIVPGTATSKRQETPEPQFWIAKAHTTRTLGDNINARA